MHFKFLANMNETDREIADDAERGERKQINNDDWKDLSEKGHPSKERHIITCLPIKVEENKKNYINKQLS